MVPFKYWGSFSKSQLHFTKISELFWEQCDIPVGDLCVSSDKHQKHTVTVEEILNSFESKSHLESHVENVDPNYNLQEVVRCHICETPGPSLHCEVCYVCLCELRRETSF